MRCCLVLLGVIFAQVTFGNCFTAISDSAPQALSREFKNVTSYSGHRKPRQVLSNLASFLASKPSIYFKEINPYRSTYTGSAWADISTNRRLVMTEEGQRAAMVQLREAGFDNPDRFLRTLTQEAALHIETAENDGTSQTVFETGLIDGVSHTSLSREARAQIGESLKAFDPEDAEWLTLSNGSRQAILSPMQMSSAASRYFDPGGFNGGNPSQSAISFPSYLRAIESYLESLRN